MIVEQANMAKIRIQTQGIDLGEQKPQTEAASVKHNSYIGKAYHVNSASIESPVIGNFGSFEEIMEAARDEKAVQKKEMMSSLSNTMTQKDYRSAEEKNKDLGNTDVEAITTVVDKMKIEMAKSSKYENFGDEISEDQIEGVTNHSGAARRLARRMSYMESDDPTEEEIRENENVVQMLMQKLQAANLPLTQENMEDSMKAYQQAKQLDAPTGGAQKYLLEKEKSLSIENLYYAEFSGMTDFRGSVNGFEQMKGQVEHVLTQAGIEAGEEALGMAEWCIANDIPLTVENIQKKQEMEQIQLPLEPEQILDAMVKAVADGKRPAEALLGSEPTLLEQSEQLMEAVERISDDQLWELVNRQQEVTVKDLVTAAEGSVAAESSVAAEGSVAVEGSVAAEGSVAVEGSVAAEGGAAGNVPGTDLARLSQLAAQETLSAEQLNVLSGTEQRFVTAKRQLEEARLIMSVEANFSLLKRGVSLDTQHLEQLVEELKQVEDHYYRQLVGNQEGLTEEEIFSVKEVAKTLNDIGEMPANTLGSRSLWEISSAESELPEKTDWTIRSLHSEGKNYQEQFDRAQERYETVGTAPRKDLGDSIQKAFQNVPEILKDLGLEDTARNERAVRILGYNSMEISETNIERIKEADALVTGLMKNLTPSATLQMIRDGYNPMDKSVTELNEKLNEIHRLSDPADHERFSKFLYQLEQKDEITPQERSSYIGVYRLLNQIEKTDGAVIGTLVNQSADITMKNLLTSIRSSHHTGKDYQIDDEFGALEHMISTADSISDQINTAFEQGAAGSQSKENMAGHQAKTEYQTQLVRQILSNLTPEKLNAVFRENEISDMSLEQLAEALEQQEDTDFSYEQMKLGEMSRASEADDYVMHLLSEFDVSYSVNHVLAANQLVHQRNRVFQQLFEGIRPGQISGKDAVADMKQQVYEEFIDALDSPEELGKTQEELGDLAEHVMETMEVDQEIKSSDLRTMHIIYHQVGLSAQMAKEETYHVPVMIGNEMTNVCLKIVSGTKEKGKVAITFETDELGKVAAELKTQNGRTEGMIAVSEEDGLETLKEQASILEQALRGNSDMETEIRFANVRDLNLNRFESGMDKERQKERAGLEEAEKAQVSSRELYQMAKRVIDVLRSL